MVTTKKWIEQYRQGDVVAREKLIRHYMRTAERIAENYYGLGVDDEDILQSAYEGLILGVDKCPKGKNYNKVIQQTIFNSIRNAILSQLFDLDGACDNFTINVVRVAILKFRRDFLEENHRLPSVEEICEKTGFLESLVIFILEEMELTKKISLDSMTFEESLEIVDGISDPEFEVVDKRGPSTLELTPRQKELYMLISSGTVNCKKLSEAMVVSKQRVSELKVRTFNKVYECRDRSGENATLKREAQEYEKTFVNRRLRDRTHNRNRN